MPELQIENLSKIVPLWVVLEGWDSTICVKFSVFWRILSVEI